MATKPAELYDEDFYAWTQQQAEALRTHFQGDNRLDVEHLAEEVEDLGKSQLQAVESYVQQIIAHLLKLDYSGFELPRRHWRERDRGLPHEPASARCRLRSGARFEQRAARAVRGRAQDGRSLAGRRAGSADDSSRRRAPTTGRAIAERDVMAEVGIELSGARRQPRNDVGRGRPDGAARVRLVVVGGGPGGYVAAIRARSSA